jgi:hypothetical protein
MPEQPPQRRPGDRRQDPAQRDQQDSASRDNQPLDIADLETAYLVPPDPLQGIRSRRAEQLAAHQAAAEDLEQQRDLVRLVVDWQDVMRAESSAERRAELKEHIDSLWSSWSEKERQKNAHRKAIWALREPDPPPPDPEEEPGE